jgi:hypothetical protein
VFSLQLCAATALGTTFLLALAGKIRSGEAFRSFVEATAQFGVAREARTAVACAAVAAELLAVGALLLPVGMPVRLGPALVLLAVLTVAVVLAARRHGQIDCHCFGATGPTTAGPHLVANIALLTLGTVAVIVPGAAVTAGDRLLAMGLGIVAGLAVASAVPMWRALVVPIPLSQKG